jgi:hypothetical protein
MSKTRVNTLPNSAFGTKKRLQTLPTGGDLEYITKGQLTTRPMCHGGNCKESKSTGIYPRSNKA